MIDCHNHILPGIDDGAHDIDMSVEMGKVAIEHGIHTIVCTPHHLNGVFSNHRADVLQAIEHLRYVFAQQSMQLTLIPGSELHLVPEVPQQLNAGHALTYGDHGRAALVELPKQTVPAGTFDHLQNLINQGVTPVIAHPERNSELARSPETLQRWVDAGCKTQLTGQSVSGDFGTAIQRVCDYWIHQQCAHIVASDAHRPRGRKPNLRPALERTTMQFGDAVATTLFIDNPQHLIDGQDIQTAPRPKRSVSGTVSRMRAKIGWF